MGTFEIKVEIKIIQYVCICKLFTLHSSLPFRPDNRWKIEDSDGS